MEKYKLADDGLELKDGRIVRKVYERIGSPSAQFERMLDQLINHRLGKHGFTDWAEQDFDCAVCNSLQRAVDQLRRESGQ
jgi:hypothetical protein